MDDNLAFRIDNFLEEMGCHDDCHGPYEPMKAALLEFHWVDGDRAEEFMLEFFREFEIDARSYQHERHFGPDWRPWLSLKSTFVMLVIAFLLSLYVGVVTDAHFNAVFFLTIMLFAFQFAVLLTISTLRDDRIRERRVKTTMPITGKDLLDAAKAKRWLMTYEDDSK